MALESHIREQLRAAFAAAAAKHGVTLANLGKAIRRANRKLKLGPPSLSRKLRGQTGMSIDEADAIAKALEYSLDWGAKE